MKIITKIEEIITIRKRIKGLNQTVGLVPTMGALHRGHLTLMKHCRRETDFVVVSIYVNPLQFGKGEDFERYPRDLKRDIKLIKNSGVDVVFIPEDKDMQTNDFSTFVEVKGKISSTLEGKFRTGHFKGVTTVVAKLFNIVSPDIAYFGKKDYQQLQIIKKMVKNLNYNIKIREIETVREKDGLAMSSRNSYLSKSERKKATCLFKSLREAKKLIEKGEKNPYNIIEKMKKVLSLLSGLDYISIVNSDNLQEVKSVAGKITILIAGQLNNIRLIDNITINIMEE